MNELILILINEKIAAKKSFISEFIFKKIKMLNIIIIIDHFYKTNKLLLIEIIQKVFIMQN